MNVSSSGIKDLMQVNPGENTSNRHDGAHSPARVNGVPGEPLSRTLLFSWSGYR